MRPGVFAKDLILYFMARHGVAAGTGCAVEYAGPAIRALPVIFVCENNLYGEYTRIEKTTPVEDIAVRAASYNMPGQVVDGQDLDAVAEVARFQLLRAELQGADGNNHVARK